MFHIVDVDVLNVLFVCSYLLGIGCSPTGCCLSHFVDLVFNYRYCSIVGLLVRDFVFSTSSFGIDY